MSPTLADSSRMPEMHCLACGHKVDATSEVVEHKPNKPKKPKPGDWSICIKCGHLAAFGNDLKLRPLTGKERRSAAADFKVAMSLYAARAAIENREKKIG